MYLLALFVCAFIRTFSSNTQSKNKLTLRFLVHVLKLFHVPQMKIVILLSFVFSLPEFLFYLLFFFLQATNTQTT